jgi:hypothetical protein
MNAVEERGLWQQMSARKRDSNSFEIDTQTTKEEHHR